MEVQYHIRPYVVGIFPYIGLIYGRYLQFRFEYSLVYFQIVRLCVYIYIYTTNCLYMDIPKFVGCRHVHSCYLHVTHQLGPVKSMVPWVSVQPSKPNRENPAEPHLTHISRICDMWLNLRDCLEIGSHHFDAMDVLFLPMNGRFLLFNNQ